jgi:hypothetical protein
MLWAIFAFAFVTVVLVTLFTCSKRSVPTENKSLQECIYAIEEYLEISNASSLPHWPLTAEENPLSN